MIAPYDPDALDRMRAGATAQQLGWSEETYRERCRRHGIEPVASGSRTPVIETPPPTSVSRVDTSLPPAPSPTAQRKRTVRGNPGTGIQYPAMLNARVTKEMAAQVYNFAAVQNVSQLEAVRRLLAAGLAAFATSPLS